MPVRTDGTTVADATATDTAPAARRPSRRPHLDSGGRRPSGARVHPTSAAASTAC